MPSTLDSPSYLLSTTKENEDPSLSSASLCIQFEMLGATFRPVFTHQIFPGEHIRGWQPPQQTILEYSAMANANTTKEVKSDELLHSSHQHHSATNKELSIHVRLAPSFQSCHVNLEADPKSFVLPRRSQILRHQPKRRRLDSESGHDNNDGGNCSSNAHHHNINSSASQDESDYNHSEHDNGDQEEEAWNQDEDSCDKKDDSEFDVDEEEGNESEVDYEEEQKEGTTRGTRMPTKDILLSMKRGLPPIVGHAKSVTDAFLRRPLGVELKEYSVNDKAFVLCLANGSESAKYHNQVQRLAVWFIETADDVDVASTEGGYWKVLYLFQKHKPTQFSLAGYVTLFHFHAPFKKPQPGIVVRICQALILPHHQRSGHGKQMMTCLLDIAHGQYSDRLAGASKKKGPDEGEIVEINVESPAPAFVMLRNRTDFDCFLRSMEENDPWIPLDKTNVADADFFTAPSESQVVQAAAKAKIIPRQVQIVMELYKLYQLHEFLRSNNKDSNKDELEKRFRLMVKKRLNKEHRENLSGLRTKAEKQAFLEDEYQKCTASYLLTLPKATSPL
jgi:histone acetyltransferase 1